MYLCKFDNGKRGETYIAAEYTDEQQKKMLADGYVSVSDEDYQYYIGNHGTGDNGTGYVRGADGKPTSAPAIVITLEQAKKTALASIDSVAESAYVGGFTSSATGTALIYDSDRDTQAEITSAANLAACNESQVIVNFASGFPIRARRSATDDKEEHYLTIAQTIALGTDWINRVKEIKRQVWDLQSKINACTTTAEVNAITVAIK